MSARYRALDELDAAIENDELHVCFRLDGSKATLSKLITDYIMAKKMTVVMFASRAKSSKTWVSKFIHEQADGISVKGIKQLAKSFGITPAKLAAQIFAKPMRKKTAPVPLQAAEPVVLIVGQTQLVIEPTTGTDPVVVEMPGWRVALTVRGSLTKG